MLARRAKARLGLCLVKYAEVKHQVNIKNTASLIAPSSPFRPALTQAMSGCLLRIFSSHEEDFPH